MTELTTNQDQLLGPFRCHEIVSENLKAFYEVGVALMEIRDQGYFKDTWKYPTFEAYCLGEWGMGRDYAYKQIAAAAVVQNVDHGIQKPTNERQARPLTVLEPDQQKEVWEMVVETAPDRKITAKHVTQTVKEYQGQDEPELEQKKEKEIQYENFNMRYAQMSIAQAECISEDFSDWKESLDKISSWIEKRKKELGGDGAGGK